MTCNNSLAKSPQHTIVLVCSQGSNIASLSPIDIRKLFLGVPVMVDGKPLMPIQNNTDALLTEVFLQKIIFMSEQSYERQLVSRVFRLGGKRPEKYSNSIELVKKLNETPGTLTYMWSEDAIDLKSLGILWSGSIN